MAVIKLSRYDKNDKRIISRMEAINKKSEMTTGYTLEPPDLDNKKSKSCIPAGEYKAYIRKKESSKWDYDVIQLKNVPNRSAIQMHAGNYPEDTNGCILPGEGRGKNAVWSSKMKLDEIFNIIGKEDIKVVIEDES